MATATFDTDTSRRNAKTGALALVGALAMLGMGYAVALSSYSENGWAVKDAVIRTRQLIGIFTSKAGNPENVYVMGHYKFK